MPLSRRGWTAERKQTVKPPWNLPEATRETRQTLQREKERTRSSLIDCLFLQESPFLYYFVIFPIYIDLSTACRLCGIVLMVSVFLFGLMLCTYTSVDEYENLRKVKETREAWVIWVKLWKDWLDFDFDNFWIYCKTTFWATFFYAYKGWTCLVSEIFTKNCWWKNWILRTVCDYFYKYQK